MQLKNEAREKYRDISKKNMGVAAKYKYIVCPGNNSGVVKKCLELRGDRWEEGNDFDTLFSFKWNPISRGIKFDQVNTHGQR